MQADESLGLQLPQLRKTSDAIIAAEFIVDQYEIKGIFFHQLGCTPRIFGREKLEIKAWRALRLPDVAHETRVKIIIIDQEDAQRLLTLGFGNVGLRRRRQPMKDMANITLLQSMLRIGTIGSRHCEDKTGSIFFVGFAKDLTAVADYHLLCNRKTQASALSFAFREKSFEDALSFIRRNVGTGIMNADAHPAP